MTRGSAVARGRRAEHRAAAPGQPARRHLPVPLTDAVEPVLVSVGPAVVPVPVPSPVVPGSSTCVVEPSPSASKLQPVTNQATGAAAQARRRRARDMARKGAAPYHERAPARTWARRTHVLMGRAHRSTMPAPQEISQEAGTRGTVLRPGAPSPGFSAAKFGL